MKKSKKHVHDWMYSNFDLYIRDCAICGRHEGYAGYIRGWEQIQLPDKKIDWVQRIIRKRYEKD